MKRNKRLFVVNIIALMVIFTLLGCIKIINYRSTQSIKFINTVKVSVFSYRADDDYIAEVNKGLEKLQAENPEKVQFTFYDSKNSQILQNEQIDKVLEEGTDLLIVNLVEVEAGEVVINKIKEQNIPVILYNREPITLDSVRSYSKAIYIGNDSKEGGILQGKILINLWNTKKALIDENNDDVMQYIMLSGGINNKEAIGRSKYSVRTVEDAGIKTEELAFRVANFDEELARRATESLLFRYGNDIEVIISNDDTMAIGAIKALQQAGYNKGDETRTITVIGFDGIPEARELIAKGIMAGTVIQNPFAMAEALYSVGMNLVSGKKPLEGTNYSFDETRVAIRIPYEGILMENNTHIESYTKGIYRN
jgi:methyl-galactoside transport system substrate-binding protein